MFVVLKVRRWECLEVGENFPFPVEFSSPDGCFGYLPVFTDREMAVEFAGDESLVREIQEASQ